MTNGEIPLWWDREVDLKGRRIRPDVRTVAAIVWPFVCRQAQTVGCDSSLAADLMESAVAQISRYLDHRGVMVFSREIHGLLIRSFQRALYRQAAKLRRFETHGTTEGLSKQVVDHSCTGQIELHVEFEEVVRRLTERSRSILALRYTGYTWKEAAFALGASVASLRSAFWRDVARVKKQISIPRRPNSDAEGSKKVHGKLQ